MGKTDERICFCGDEESKHSSFSNHECLNSVNAENL
jgi:hypothetical protein